MNNAEKILVIKLGALGDFMLALGGMEAIRRHHPAAQITLLTTKPFADIAQRSKYFNDVWIDTRPKFYELDAWFLLARRLNKARFARVYDLQANDRTAFYRRLMRNKPLWFGGKGDALEHAHAYPRLKARLAAAGIESGMPDLSWMQTGIAAFDFKNPYVLLVPGSAPTRPEKRWPALKYGALGKKLMWHGYDVAVIGTNAEHEVIARVVKSCPGIHDLSGRTSLYDIASLAAKAAGAVGNDTGPMHVISQTGCPVTVLFSEASDPARCAPIGEQVTVLQAEDLDDLSLDTVFKNFHPKES